MITSARIEALRGLGGFSWITCLRAPAIRLLAEQGALQLSLFDEQNLAEAKHFEVVIEDEDERGALEEAVVVLRRVRAQLDTAVPVRFRGVVTQGSATLFPHLGKTSDGDR